MSKLKKKATAGSAADGDPDAVESVGSNYPTSYFMDGSIRPTTAQFVAAWKLFTNDVNAELTEEGSPLPGCADFSEPGFGKSITLATYLAMHFALWKAYINSNSTIKVFDVIYVITINDNIKKGTKARVEKVFGGTPSDQELMETYIRYADVGKIFSEIEELPEPYKVCVVIDEVHDLINQKGVWKSNRLKADEYTAKLQEEGIRTNKIRAVRVFTATPIENSPVEMSSILQALNRFEPLEPKYIITETDTYEQAQKKIFRAFRHYGFFNVYYPSMVTNVIFGVGKVRYEKITEYIFRSDEEGNLVPFLSDRYFKPNRAEPMMVEMSDLQKKLYDKQNFPPLGSIEEEPINFGTMIGMYQDFPFIKPTSEGVPRNSSAKNSPKFSTIILDFLTRGCPATIIHVHAVDVLTRENVIDLFRHNDLVARFRHWKTTGSDYGEDEVIPRKKGFTILDANAFDTSSDLWDVDNMRRQNKESGKVYYLQLSGKDPRVELTDWAQKLPSDAPIIVIISDKLGVGLNFKNINNIGLISPAWQPGKTSQIIYRIIRADSDQTEPKRVFLFVSSMGDNDTHEIHRYKTSQRKYEMADNIMQGLIEGGSCLTRAYLPPIPTGTIVHQKLSLVEAGEKWKEIQKSSFFPIMTTIEEMSSHGRGKDWLLAFYTVYLSYLGINLSVFRSEQGDAGHQLFRTNIIVAAAYSMARQREKALTAAKTRNN